MFKQKLVAFFSHFLLSLLLMIIAGYIVFGVWYHKPYYKLFNVMPIFGLMLAVDLILGPLLTLVVYKKGKKTLKMDLVIIVLIQITAFGWGIWNIANARPAWIAIKQGVGYTISPAYLSNPKNELKVKVPSIFEQNWAKPKTVMLPKDDKSDVLVYETDKYLPYDSQEAIKNQISIKEFEKYDNELYQSVATKYPNAMGYIPVLSEASTNLLLLILDANGEILDTVFVENKLIVKEK